jgi:hypothetical protein
MSITQFRYREVAVGVSEQWLGSLGLDEAAEVSP